MRHIRRLDQHSDFPPTWQALDEPNGLLAVGGDLDPGRLLAAYRRGIFPWYDSPQPVLWWTPDPRSVLFPEELHVSRSLRRTLRKQNFLLQVDTAFDRVVDACAQLRGDGLGTWIDEDMKVAYATLHSLGYAHSVEVYADTDVPRLIGGLYGVALGGIFFGESMFSRVTDASKVALVALVDILRRGNFHLVDCQVESEHMNSMGARCLDRLDFEARLAQTVDDQIDSGIWQLPERCGALL